MSGDPGDLAVNTRVHTYYPMRTRGCGCAWHPAFPTPSVSWGQRIHAGLGRDARREGESVSRRHCEEAMGRAKARPDRLAITAEAPVEARWCAFEVAANRASASQNNERRDSPGSRWKPQMRAPAISSRPAPTGLMVGRRSSATPFEE
jgi:hypothetical protein